MNSNDDSGALIQRVQEAVDSATPLRIRGGNSKHLLGNAGPPEAETGTLSVLSHTGIISYDPTELVVTVRSGTTMHELNSVLEDAGQMLPFEPPSLPHSTIGGVLACGLSGPRRPFSGSARDYVLGTRIINGRAQDLSFGGQVMKNVAGYDVSRVQIGAWGTLGVLLDISMKVLPTPEAELTLVHTVEAHDTAGFSALMRQPLPLSGAMLMGQTRYLRLGGSAAAVKAAASELGGDVLNESEAQVWTAVRNHEHAFFTDLSAGMTLWRISVADFAPPLTLSGEYLYEWSGAQRWLKTDVPASEVFAAALAAGGHASRYSAALQNEPAFQPLTGPMQRLQARVRDSFDPLRLFNRGRFHPELDNVESGQMPVSA